MQQRFQEQNLKPGLSTDSIYMLGSTTKTPYLKHVWNQILTVHILFKKIHISLSGFKFGSLSVSVIWPLGSFSSVSLPPFACECVNAWKNERL